MTEETQFECPGCGGPVYAGNESCAACGMVLDWSVEPEEESTGEAPAEEPSQEPAPAEAMAAPEGEVTAPEEVAAPAEAPPEPAAPAVAPSTKAPPRRYAGLSVVGLGFAVLTVLALVATLVAARYDTLVQGASEEAVGDRQLLFIYLGVAGVVVCAAVAAWDAVRGRGK